MLFLITNFLIAQNASDIVGKWHQKDEEGITKCYFFEHQDNLYGLVYYYKGAGEEFSLEKELKKYKVEGIEDLSSEDIFQYLAEFIWFKKFEPDGDEWNGKFIYPEKGETSTFKSTLKSISKDKLKVSFRYWGIWDSSIWKRAS